MRKCMFFIKQDVFFVFLKQFRKKSSVRVDIKVVFLCLLNQKPGF